MINNLLQFVFSLSNRFTRYCFYVVLVMSLLYLTACDFTKPRTFPGYVEGEFTYISSLVSGTLESLKVTPGMKVNRGQLLFALSLSPEKEMLTMAREQVEEALNQVQKAQANYLLQKNNHQRNVSLRKKDIISKEEIDNSTTIYQQELEEKEAAEARLKSLQASAQKALWEVQQKSVTAPVDGTVFDTYYTVGENVLRGKPVLSLLSPGQVKIIFFIPETELGHLKLKQQLLVHCDNCAKNMNVEVTYISQKVEYTPPIIYSNEERQKLVFRVEARPLKNTVLAVLHPGQPVTVAFDKVKNNK